MSVCRLPPEELFRVGPNGLEEISDATLEIRLADRAARLSPTKGNRPMRKPLPIRLSPIDTSNGYDPYDSAPLWRHTTRAPRPLEWSLPR